MFRKLKAGLQGKGSKAKYRLDVAVAHVDGLPPGVAACRLQWARGAKVAVTKLVAASAGTVTWNEELSQIATLLKAPSGFEAKEYEFKLQAPDRSNSQKPPATIGKAVLDMAKFAGPAAGMGQQVVLQVQLVGGGRATLHLMVGAAEVKGMAMDDDNMSVMTGASALSSTSPSAMEQDLSGFRMDPSRDLAGVPHLQPTPSSTAAASSPRSSAPPSAAASAAIGSRPSTVAEEVSAVSSGAERQQLEVDALKKDIEGQDAQLAHLQQELAAAQQQLAAVPVPAAVAHDGQLRDMQEQNTMLAKQVDQLRGELTAAIAATAAVSAAAAAATTAAAAEPSSAGSAQLQEQLAAAEARVGELEQQLAAASEQSHSSAGANSGDAAAKLALAEQRIQQLMVLVQQTGGSGAAQSDREAELEVRLQAAEYDVGEAEQMAQEAMNMAELAQVELAELRGDKERLEQELAALQEQTEQAHSSSKWTKEREAKREADWDARLKEAYKRMEESVMLAERTQREKDDLQGQYSVLLREKQAIETKLDPDALDQQMAMEVEAAKQAAEAQARIEVGDLQQRLRSMEEYVEDADARRLQMASRVGELELALASVKQGEEDTYHQVKSAEDRADGLSLELQYVQSEMQRVAHELDMAQDQLDRRTSDYQRDVGEATSRADAMQQQLEETRAQLRQEAAVASELRNRVLLLEEDLESGKVQLVHAQQQAALAAAAGGAAVAGEAAAQRRQLEADLALRQRAAEDRAAQLEAVSRELAGVRESLADAQAQREHAESQLAEARRSLAATTSTVVDLEAALAGRDVQLQQAQEAQRAVMLSVRGRVTSEADGDGGLSAAELRGQLHAAEQARDADVANLTMQLADAQQLAQYSAGEMAGLVQQLTEVQGERGEIGAKLADLQEEVSRLRAGSDGELRAHIEQLEKDVVVQRNRAEVNALFKEEHDRIAMELVETKLVWAEAQEQLVKLKRSLVKSQEKNITFASRLTKMETKMYQSFNGTASSVQKGAQKLGSKLSMKRGGSKDKEVAGDASSPLPSPNAG